ncbi:hypothetical protein N0V95_009488 [Ascochyta clinopodiicola]|nr:hypothetical protein N0V95_009488 [Ascochyta clinopodiicola]
MIVRSHRRQHCGTLPCPKFNRLGEPSQNAEIAGALNKLDGVVFPQASAHYQFNGACKRAVFVAALDSNNPGTLQLARTLFSFNAGVVNATLGFPKTIDGKDIDDY